MYSSYVGRSAQPLGHIRWKAFEGERPTHRYVAQAVKPENAGASITHTFRISTGMLIMCKKFQMRPEVTMRPG